MTLDMGPADTLTAFSEALTPDNVIRTLRSYTDQLGLGACAIGPLLNPLSQSIDPYAYGRTDFPSEFRERWIRQDYMLLDPVTLHALQTTELFEWIDARKRADANGRRISDFVTDFDIHGGVATGVRLAGLPTGTVSIASRDPKGEVDLSPADRAALLTVMRRAYERMCETNGLAEALRSRRPALSTREIEILHLVAGGKSNGEIGIILQIRSDTVKKHIARIRKKLDCVNRTHAVTVAIRMGLLMP